jgi:hypothetical protein
MKSLSRKCLLGVVALLCMAPASFANKPNKDKDKCRPGVNCQQLPEGGSAAIYLLGGWDHMLRGDAHSVSRN